MSLEYLDVIKSHAAMINSLHPNVIDQLAQTNSCQAYGRWCGLWTGIKILEANGVAVDDQCKHELYARLIYLADRIVAGLPKDN